MKKICAIIFLALISALGVSTAVRIGLYALPDYFASGGSLPSVILPFVLDTESNLQNQMMFRGNWIDLYGGIMRLTGAKMVRDVEPKKTVYRMKNGGLTFIRFENPPLTETQSAFIREIKSAADAAGAESWFISIPQKTCTQVRSLCPSSRGVADQAEAIDAYRRQVFADSGYSVLDLHEKMHEQPGLHERFYFKSDHHWTAEAGLWATGQIAQALSLPTALLDTAQFTAKIYPNVMFGSLGKRTGRLYCEAEDMYILFPKRDTAFTICIGDELEKEGSFANTLIYPDYLNQKINNETYRPYASFLRGDHGHMSIRNMQNRDGARIVLLKDSFSNVIVPYLALVCAQVDILDTRYYSGDVIDWIRQNEPDAVLVTTTAGIENSYFAFSGDGNGS